MPFKSCSFRASSELDGTFTRPTIYRSYSVDGSAKGTFDRSGGAFDANSGVFTVPHTGVYLFTVKVTFTDDGNSRLLTKLMKNNTGYDEIIDSMPATYYMSHDVTYSGMHYAEAGDNFAISDEIAPSGGYSTVIWTACYMQNG